MRRLVILCIFMATVVFLNSTRCGAGSISTDKNMQPLIKKLKSPDAEKRASAAFSLGNMGSKAVSAIPYLIEILGDNQTVKKQDGNFFTETYPMLVACDALVKIGKASVEPLIEVFKDKSKNSLIRQNVATTLGKLHDPMAIEPLIEFLKHKDDKSWDEYGFIADRTKTALEEITGQDNKKTGQSFGVDYTKWRGWYDKNK